MPAMVGSWDNKNHPTMQSKFCVTLLTEIIPIPIPGKNLMKMNIGIEALGQPPMAEF